MKVNFLRCHTSYVVGIPNITVFIFIVHYTITLVNSYGDKSREKKVHFEYLSTWIKCKIVLWNHLLSRSIQLNSIYFLICKMKCDGINHNLLFVSRCPYGSWTFWIICISFGNFYWNWHLNSTKKWNFKKAR